MESKTVQEFLRWRNEDFIGIELEAISVTF
jgi:hypothetical protein